MAKQKKETAQVEEIKSGGAVPEKFYINESPLLTGYTGKADDSMFVIEKGFTGVITDPNTGDKKIGFISQPMVFQAGKRHEKDDKGFYFEDLTFLQIHTLAQAKVIKLSKEQGDSYNAQLREFYKK